MNRTSSSTVNKKSLFHIIIMLSLLCHVHIFQAIYRGFGGGDRGLTFKELLCGLVLLVDGSKQEKAKCKL